MTTHKIFTQVEFPLEDDVRFVEINGKIKYKIILKKYLVQDEKLLNIIINLDYTPKLISNNKDYIVVEYIEGNQITWDEFYDKHLDTFIYLSNKLFNKTGITYSEISMYNFIKKDKLYWIDFDSFRCDCSFKTISGETWGEIGLRKHLIDGKFRQSLLDNKNFFKYDTTSYVKFLNYKGTSNDNL